MSAALSDTAIGAAILVVALLLVAAAAAWWWRRRRPARIDSPEEAADAAEAALAGFAVTGAVVGADGSGALAVAEDGRVAVMRRRGARIAVREVAWPMLRSSPAGIVVETRDRRLGQVALAGVNALDIRRVAGSSVSVPLRT